MDLVELVEQEEEEITLDQVQEPFLEQAEDLMLELELHPSSLQASILPFRHSMTTRTSSSTSGRVSVITMPSKLILWLKLWMFLMETLPGDWRPKVEEFNRKIL